MCQYLSAQHPHQVGSIGRVHRVKPLVHLLLCNKRLDDPQTTQCLLHLTHRVAPQRLSLDRLRLQFPAYPTHKPAHDGHDGQGKQRQLPRDKQQGCKITDNQDGVLKQHLQTRHDGVFHLIHVTAHPRDDVPLPFLREEAQRQRRDLLVNLVAHVPDHTCPDRQHRDRSQEIRSRLQGRHYCQEHPDQQ